MSAETRGTEVSMGFVNDVYFFTVIQEILHGWLLETYPDLELGTFLYKTTSLHCFVDKYGGPLWSNHLLDRGVEMPSDINKLNYTNFIKEMGLLYYYVDQQMKAREVENIDAGIITTYNDVLKPRIEDFKSLFFYNWARTLLKIKTI
jgi:hypothetical protein